MLLEFVVNRGCGTFYLFIYCDVSALKTINIERTHNKINKNQ